MALPSSGPLSLTDIQTEFGGTNPISLNEYYAGGGLVPSGTTGTYGAVPTSGQISIQNFYGTSNVYAINNSLRFRRSASANLSRTPSSATNRTTFTWSGWVKIGEIPSGDRNLFATTGAGDTGAFYFGFINTGVVALGLSTYFVFQTTQVLRDPSSWYHIVLAIDTTQATSSNRVKLYINGNQVTAFGSLTYPAQNATLGVNSTNPHVIGGPNYFDGYMAEVNFIDGQALTPSSFGETNATTGSWYPKAYTGTYGTNGFYQKYSNIALTSGSNTGLGQDFSGNGRFFNTNNISVTAGVTYDAMTDSPTPVSATVGNYATFNPLAKSSSVTLSNANLTGTGSGVANNRPFTVGQKVFNKCYWEMQITTVGFQNNRDPVGVVQIPFNPSTFADDTLYAGSAGSGLDSVQLSASIPGVAQNGSTVFSIPGLTNSNNDIYMFAYDSGKLWIGKNGTWYNSGNPAAGTGAIVTNMTGEAVPIAFCYGASVWQFNGGQRAFTYTIPSGFARFQTFNLPTSTIVKGNSYMDATLYTGNGGTQTITNASGLRPDLVWFKERSSNSSNWWFDTIRGIYNRISSNETVAEASQTNSLTAFNANGFSVGSDVAGNESGQTYVAWQWIASASTVTNTSGTISSQVRANTTAGFSIVTYTGNGVGGATVGHGLGVAPKFIIAKTRNNVDNWPVGTSALGWNQHLLLNLTNATAVTSSTWSDTAPTSTVFTIGTDNRINANTWTYVAYCWAEIAGFSKFGSYTGNGSTDGVFVYLGFRPKYILIKRSSAAGDNWPIVDTSRNPFNVTNLSIEANNFAAEQTGTSSTMPTMDLLSNGFKLRTTSVGGNASGSTYIYAAFAENPFKNANAR